MSRRLVCSSVSEKSGMGRVERARPSECSITLLRARPPVARPHRRETDPGRAEIPVGRIARYDAGRLTRTGVPEVVLAEGKDPRHIVEILRQLDAERQPVLVSRLTPAAVRHLKAA